MSAVRAVRGRIVAFLRDPEAPNPGNPIHSGSGARKHGFAAALVGGVDVYGFAVATIVESVGEGWLGHGWVEVGFRRPVYPGDALDVAITADGELRIGAGEDVRVEGRVGAGDAPWLESLALPERRRPEPATTPAPRLTPENVPVGRDLAPRAVTLDLAEHERFCRERQPERPALFLGANAHAHPAWLASQPIWLLHHSFDYGPAVHTASLIQHRRAVQVGASLVVAGRCVDAFERKGHRYIVNDCALFDVAGRVTTQIRHTAIYRLATAMEERA